MPDLDKADLQWLSHSKQWRLVLLIALFFGVLAFIIGMLLETPAAQVTSFDTVAYPLMTTGMVFLLFLLAATPRSLRMVVTCVITGTSLFFVAKLAFLVFSAVTPLQFQLNITETFYWIPIIYLLGFLVPGVRVGKLVASSFTAVFLALSAYYVFATAMPEQSWGVVYALAQLNIVNGVQLALTYAFIRFKESYTREVVRSATIADLAYTDSLTGLHNRTALELELSKLPITTGRGERAAILFIDLDNFKLINDTLGHATGDMLLAQVAKRLNSVDEKLYVARLSGDEFIVLARHLGPADFIDELVQKVQAVLVEPLFIGGQYLQVTASIGVSIYPEHAQDVTDLLRHADSAMYQVKHGGKNGFRCFQSEADSVFERERKLEKDLPTALADAQFELYYQPVLDLLSGQTVKVEALLRWQHPELGPVSPADFIPIAERSGFISKLGSWVLGQACADLRSWQELGWLEGRVAVNVSPIQFSEPDFHKSVLSQLREAGLCNTRLELEVTESLTLTDPVATQKTLKTLRGAGVSVALDDFGTGYSSLAHLRDLPIDTIKIDRTFVNDLATPLGQPQFAVALIESIIKLADHLDLLVVAEGIETAAQKDLLMELGVHLGQGYYFAKPLPAEELQLFLGQMAQTERAALSLN